MGQRKAPDSGYRKDMRLENVGQLSGDWFRSAAVQNVCECWKTAFNFNECG